MIDVGYDFLLGKLKVNILVMGSFSIQCSYSVSIVFFISLFHLLIFLKKGKNSYLTIQLIPKYLRFETEC